MPVCAIAATAIDCTRELVKVVGTADLTLQWILLAEQCVSTKSVADRAAHNILYGHVVRSTDQV